jgi:hypothetical protein
LSCELRSHQQIVSSNRKREKKVARDARLEQVEKTYPGCSSPGPALAQKPNS